MTSESCNTPTPELSVDQQLCYLLHLNSNRFIGRWDRFLRGYGLTYTEYIVMLTIWERWPVGENSLAQRLQFDLYTLEDALSQLERRRLITRSEDHGMPGHRVVEASRKSLDLQPELMAIRSKFACDLGLSDADAKLLKQQLEKLALVLSGMSLSQMEQPA